MPLHVRKEKCPNDNTTQRNAPVGHSVDGSRSCEEESVWSVALANARFGEAPVVVK